MVLTVTVQSKDEMEYTLTTAVDKVRKQSPADCRHGILITRHSAGVFTVALTPDVPFGLTREKYAV